MHFRDALDDVGNAPAAKPATERRTRQPLINNNENKRQARQGGEAGTSRAAGRAAAASRKAAGSRAGSRREQAGRSELRVQKLLMPSKRK